MAFTQVQDLDAEITIALGGQNRKTGKKNPTQVEGYYLGSRKVESKKARDGFVYLHILQTSEGNLGVWGKTDLDRKLLCVAPGTMVRLTHVGMQATPNGEMYKYKVEQDSENTISVSFTSFKNATDDSEDAELSEDEESSDEEEVDPAPLVASKSNNKISVEELLKRNRK